MANVDARAKLELLRNRAKIVKEDKSVRHEPTQHDIEKASENATVMQEPQFSAIHCEVSR